MNIIPQIKLFIDAAKQKLGEEWLPLKSHQFGDTINPTDQPLETSFESLKRVEEQAGKYEVPFLSKTSMVRYFPGQLGKAAGEHLLPQNIFEAGLFAIPMGTILKPLAKTSIGKAVAKIATKDLMPTVFKGFSDITTKILNKLVGRTTVSRQFISDLTNSPELKQTERNVIRNVLDSYRVKTENVVAKKGVIPQALAVGKAGIPKKLESFAEFAQKAGSEEKFMKNLEDYNVNDRWIFHGTTEKNANLIEKEGFKNYSTYFTNNPQTAKMYNLDYYPKRTAVIVVDKNQLKIANLSDYYKKFGTEENFMSWAIKNKYDGVSFDFGKTRASLVGEIRIFDSSKIKQQFSISSFTDFYNQAVKGTKSVSDQIPVQEFADKVKSELLPLKMKPTFRYADYNFLPNEVKGNIANAQTHIWELPIKTSAGEIHFKGASRSYFGHTRIEDMAVKVGEYKPTTKATEALKRYEALKTPSATRRVIEVQSDLYQKGGLEREMKFSNSWRGDKEVMSRVAKRDAEIVKLQQYNDPTAHFRMVREEVKQAAIDDKTKLQFPTGKTAMKIEGLGETASFYEQPGEHLTTIFALKSEELKVGMTIYQRGARDGIVVTDILGDGKFKAVPKNKYDEYQKVLKPNESIFDYIKKYTTVEETFDISGKIDTSNPIYRFYEKDLGRYLKSKYNAQFVKDDKGVSWWEISLKKEWGKMPVEAFGGLPFLGALPQTQEDYNNESTIPYVPNKQPLFITK